MTVPIATSGSTRSSRLAWFGVAAPPLAWATQLLVGYSFQEAGCGRPDGDLWGADLNWLTGIVVIICGAIAVAGGLAALTALRSDSPPDVRSRVVFLAVAGVAASFIFLLAIVLTGIALFPLNACRPG